MTRGPVSRLDAAAARLGRPVVVARFLAKLLSLALVIGGASVLVLAIIAPSASVAAAVVGTVDRDLLDFPPLPSSFGEPAERSVILARDGSRLAVLRDENRVVVDLDEVPAHVVNAVIATEDASVRDHDGVDWRAVVRAAMGNVRAGEVTSGASTISQQLVKLLTAQDDRTVERKLREAYYALQLEQRLSKDEILAEYLNRAYFGNAVYGIGTAAEYYFSTPVSQLTVAQGALLAGIIRTPEGNDPIEHPEAALARRAIVLRQMADVGLLDAEDAERHSAEPLGLVVSGPIPTREPFFVTYVRHLLAQDPALGPDPATRSYAAATGGLVIRTTLDPGLTAMADQAIREVLPDPNGPQAALTVVDPRSGEVLAIGVGPRSFGDGPGQTQVTPAVAGLGSPFGRQPGSAFKALMVVAALEAGVPPEYRIDTPSPYTPSGNCKDVPGQEPWRPGNYSDGGGGVLDLAEATAKSSNVYFAKLVDTFVPPPHLSEVAYRMGVTSAEIEPTCAAVLGAEDVYGLDLASAFGVLANAGSLCRPHAIAEVLDRRGRTISRGGEPCRRAVEPAIAARAAEILRGPIETGTASRNGRIGRPAIGKTGTTSDYRDAWFVGAIPQLSAASWVGYEIPAELRDPRCSGGRVTGGCLPTMIWQRFMARATEALALPVQDFPTPPPVPRRNVPDVLGEELAEAIEAIEDEDLDPVAESVHDWRPEGTVVQTNPPVGTSVTIGSRVIVSVSDGAGRPPTIPDVLGLPRRDAEDLLRRFNLEFQVLQVPVDDRDDYGVVVRQQPRAGASANGVEVITLDVGRPRTADDPTPTPRPSRSPAPAPSPDEDDADDDELDAPPTEIVPDPAATATDKPSAEPSPATAEPDDEDGRGPDGQGPPGQADRDAVAARG